MTLFSWHFSNIDFTYDLPQAHFLETSFTNLECKK